MVEEEKPEEVVEKPKQPKSRYGKMFFRILGLAIIVIGFIILVAIKRAYPEFSIWLVLTIGLGILLLGAGLWFGMNIKDLFSKRDLVKDDEKVPPPISYEEAIEVLKQRLLSPEYANYVRGFLQHRIYNVGKTSKQRVLLIQVDGFIYPEDGNFWFLFINLNYPDMWDNSFQEKYNPSELLRIVNSLASDPEDEPDIEKRTELDLKEGKQTIYEKRTKRLLRKARKEKEEESLV